MELNMDENEIMQLIDAEATRRSATDRSHLDGLHGELTDGLPQWSARMRLVNRVAAMTVLLAVPAAYAALLPHPAPATHVTCSQPGADAAVVDCATLILTLS